MDNESPDVPEGLALGAAIIFLRRRVGMPQHELTRRLGLSARSNLSDYERGRRVPPPDIILACEEIFGLRGGELQRLRRRTLDERARSSASGARPGDSSTTIEDEVRHGPGPEPADGAARVPAEASGIADPGETGPVDGRRHRLQRVMIVAGAGAVLASLSAFASLHMALGGNPQAATAAHPRGLTPQPVRGRFSDRTHHDGDDPLVTGCSQDVVTRARIAVLLPGGAVFGQLLLRHSPVCDMSWGAVWGPNPDLYRVYITARRPGDHATAPSSWAGNTLPGSYGNMLSTASGCVEVSAYVQTPTGTGPVATTTCAT